MSVQYVFNGEKMSSSSYSWLLWSLWKPFIKKVIRYLIIPVLLALTTSSSTLRLLGVSHLSCSLWVDCEREALSSPAVPSRAAETRFLHKLTATIFQKQKVFLRLSLLFSLFIFLSLVTNGSFPLSQIDGIWDKRGFNFLVLCVHKSNTFILHHCSVNVIFLSHAHSSLYREVLSFT